ncbi:MAG: hypothetical protein M0R80_27730 [Proteobacteria bacterium]|jgi:hypothetical protein|nr:hypothetical protein [Pseudomonadota bacterium]
MGKMKNWTITSTTTCWTDTEVWAETEEEAREKFLNGEYDADKSIDIDFQDEEIQSVKEYGEEVKNGN